MATHAPITGAQTRAPAIARRNLLGALALAPIVALPGLAGATAPAVDRTAWDRALATYEAARAAEQHYDVTVCRPMEAELERLAPRPNLWFDLTARDGRTARFHVPLNDLDRYDHHISPSFRAGADEVKAKWFAHVEACRSLHHEEINDEWDRLDDIAADARHALMVMPAPDCSALWWKVDQLFGPASGRKPEEEGDGYCVEWTDAWVADAERLLRSANAHRQETT